MRVRAKTRTQPSKRVVLTLTAAEVEKFQAFCRAMNMPPAILSHAVDDIIRDMNKALAKVDRSKPMSLVDIFTILDRKNRA